MSNTLTTSIHIIPHYSCYTHSLPKDMRDRRLLASLDSVVDSLVVLAGDLWLEVEVDELGLVVF
jgi:hypothetical protein